MCNKKNLLTITVIETALKTFLIRTRLQRAFATSHEPGAHGSRRRRQWSNKWARADDGHQKPVVAAATKAMWPDTAARQWNGQCSPRPAKGLMYTTRTYFYFFPLQIYVYFAISVDTHCQNGPVCSIKDTNIVTDRRESFEAWRPPLLQTFSEDFREFFFPTFSRQQLFGCEDFCGLRHVYTSTRAWVTRCMDRWNNKVVVLCMVWKHVRT